MTLIEAAKLALEAMHDHGTSYLNHEDEYSTAIDCLRVAIEQSEKRTPSLWINGTTKDCTFNPHTADNWLKQGHAVRPYYKD